MSTILINELPRWLLLLAWIIINAIAFGVSYSSFKSGKEYFYLRSYLGEGFATARSAALCLNLNCMIILIPICRNLVHGLRKLLSLCCRRSIARQMDKQFTYHRYLGYTIGFFTILHVCAHYFNFEYFVTSYDQKDNSIIAALNNLPSQFANSSEYVLNPLHGSSYRDSMLLMITSGPGATGVLVTVCLLMIVSSSTELIRRSYFELFWFSHHLFVLFFVLLGTHGIGDVLKRQINVAEHDPEFCSSRTADWGKIAECPLPKFSAFLPQAWLWFIVPVVIYVIERIWRFSRLCRSLSIQKVIDHPSNVIEIQISKQYLRPSTGQYVFLYCSKVSYLEWHPFTLTTAPDDDYLSVHVRMLGDWTKKLSKVLRSDDGQLLPVDQMPRLVIDGPFGTCAEDIFLYDIVVLVGCGIGVTPFASVLRHIMHNRQRGGSKLRKVYFYWLCPEPLVFEWFQQLLSELETKATSEFLNINIHLTRGWNDDIILRERQAARRGSEHDVITHLQNKTHYGRPDWDQVFQNICASEQAHASVGVFFCGPSELSAELHKKCNRFSSTSSSGVHFHYNKENF